ncbi:hypothetical protein AgCh_001507 [Apium graveolens]
MHRASASFSSFSSAASSRRSTPLNSPNNTPLVSIQCFKTNSKSEEWAADTLQTGDIVDIIAVGNLTVRAPFKNGKTGVQKILHECYKSKDTSIRVRVRRGSDEFAELEACIVPNESGGRKQYLLRSIRDPNYAVGFVDRTEAECLNLQASRNSRMVDALAKTPLQDGHVAYPWEKKMQEQLSVPNSSFFLSMLFLPRTSDKNPSRYNDLEDTLARSNAWLTSSQASGVPIVFMNIQTESLLTKISGETASSTVNTGSLSDLANLASASLYGFEDYHGVDIGVVRAVRLWYSPLEGEVPIEIKIKESDTKLGFAISRTEEGFLYISSVAEGDENSPSTRSGLCSLYKEANRSGKLLVVSRVSNQKVLPWIVSQTGAIRCYDTVSLSQKLSLHRHARVSIHIHIFSWDRGVTSLIKGISIMSPTSSELRP